MKVNNFFKTLKNVFGNWKYLTLVAFLSFTFYSLNVLISNWNSLRGFYSSLGFLGTLKFFLILFFGFKNLILFSSFITLIIISILFGILLSLIVYKSRLKIKIDNKKIGFLGSMGIFIGAFVPGCVTCGVGLVSLFGISAGALAFLPYDGIELSILAILILGFTITRVTKNMYSCNVQILKGGKK